MVNIFWLHEDNSRCAEFYCDQHLNITQKEIAQLLSTVLREEGYEWDFLYKRFCPTNPIVLWLREDMSNIEETVDLAYEIYNEARDRLGMTHKSYRTVTRWVKQNLDKVDTIHDWGGSEKYLAPNDKDYSDDPIKFYRKLYVEEKSDFATWSREEPWWYKAGLKGDPVV